MQPSLNTVVYNETSRITGLLQHAASYCDELVVVDQSSTDGTGDLARDFGAIVITDECRGTSELSYPLAADHTAGEWVLILDADEVLAPWKVSDLINLGAQWDGASLARATWIDGERWKTGPDRQLRYFRKGAVRYATRIHTYNEMLPARALYRSGPDPWILHTKTRTEQVADDARYQRIAEKVAAL